jgi:hypothetical protein
MKDNIAYIYSKKANGSTTGVISCVLIAEDKIFTGSAVCSENDKYNHKVGKQLALERAQQAYERWKANCKKNKKAKKSKSTKPKGVVAHYVSINDKKTYANGDDSFYKTTSYKNPTYHGYDKVEVSQSKLDKSALHPDVPSTTIQSDGNGLQVEIESKIFNNKPYDNKFYLSYSTAVELELALQKYHQSLKYSKFKRVK